MTLVPSSLASDVQLKPTKTQEATKYTKKANWDNRSGYKNNVKIIRIKCGSGIRHYVQVMRIDIQIIDLIAPNPNLDVQIQDVHHLHVVSIFCISLPKPMRVIIWRSLLRLLSSWPPGYGQPASGLELLPPFSVYPGLCFIRWRIQFASN